MSAVVRWHLVRHAPVANPAGAIYGASDLPADLSDREALAGLARRLPDGARLVTTPLARSRDTATALAGAGWKPGEPAVEPRLAEQDFGRWEGLTHAALDAAGDAAYRAFWQAPGTASPPGGESFAEVIRRVAAALDLLGSQIGAGDIVAVVHGGSIRAALALALGLAPEAALGFEIAPLSLTRLDRIAGHAGAAPSWRIGGVNLPAR